MQHVELSPEVRAAVVELGMPGFERFCDDLIGACTHRVPNPYVDIVDWIQDKCVIPNGNRPGRVVPDVIQRTIARAFQTKGVRRVVYLKPPRAGSSLLLALLLLYFACHEAQDVIFYERTIPDAQDFHDKKLIAILKASEDLRHLLRETSGTEIKDAWTDIYLANGAVALVSPATADATAADLGGMLMVTLTS